MSHTVTVSIELRDRAALAAAIETLGGRVIGEGQHRLYSSTEQGYAIQLPCWQYPIIVREDGTLAYDNYNGAWGNRADLDALIAAYATERVVAECARLGWYCERQADGAVLVYHPDGGTLTVAAGGSIDAHGFTGAGCAAATAPLVEALGSRAGETRKREYNLAHLAVGVVS